MFLTSQITRSISGNTCPLTDDDKSFPGLIDKGKLLELEKESDTLSRKVQKRLKQRDNSKNSKGFIQKVFRWHHQKKMDKIKSLMNSLFPKLTKSESEVSQWLKSVSEEKEIAWQRGNYILHDIERQIERFQTHLDFVDEVINDIKQLDYDVFKEIRDIKAAFAFNQEVVEKFQAQKFSDSNSISSNESSDVNSNSNTHHKAQEHPSMLPTSPVETMAPTTSGQTSGHGCEAIFTKTVVPSSAAPAPNAPVTCHNPAVWQGVKLKKGTVNMVAKSPFTKSLGDSSSSLSHGEIDMDQSELADSWTERSGPVSEDRSSHTYHAPHDISDFLSSNLDLDPLAPCEWDGADSKRKALQSMTVSLSSLKPCANQSKPSGCKAGSLLGLGRLLDNFSSGNDSSRGERSVSADSKISQLQDLRTRRNRSRSSSDIIIDAHSLNSTDACSLLSDSENDSEDATSKMSSIFSAFSSWSGKSSPIIQGTSKRSGGGGGVVPMLPKAELTRSISLVSAVSSASDESSGSSSSSGGIACSNNNDLCTCRTPVKLGNQLGADDPATFSDRLVSDTPSPTKGDDVQRKKKKKRCLPASHEDPDKIVSVITLLRQIDEKNYSTQFTDSSTLDDDQIEMLRRIEKCLLVKESLKSILLAMELTREKEMTSLRGVKRLKNNLKEAIVQYECITVSDPIESAVSDSSSLSSQPTVVVVGLYTVACSDGLLQHSSVLQLESGDATPQLSEEADYNITMDHFAEPSSLATSAGSLLSDHNSSAIATVGTERREPDASALQASTTPSTPPFKSAVVHALTPTAIADPNSLAEVTVCVGHLTKLLSEEMQAKERLAKLTNLIINVQTINKELTELEPPAKDELSEA